MARIQPETMKAFVREELSGWKRWEIAWLLAACIVIAALSIYWRDTVIEIVSATTGVAREARQLGMGGGPCLWRWPRSLWALP